ncbi:MAG: DUF3857 domain-containing protein [Mucilaginibacter polytrichastri]|nr:DUF3857 domain-containing protein [Mucilaginibacter polytrichastri]
MKKLLFTFLCMGTLCASAQDQFLSEYGKVPVADLEMTTCDFEKDANAMVLFDKGDIFFDDRFAMIFRRHKRIKILNDKARDEADIRLEFHSLNHYEQISDVQAQTINLVDGKPVITKLDRKSIFYQPVDKYTTAVIFTFPNVKPGSVIEYKFRRTTQSFANVPEWFFQGNLPVRYSEFKTAIPEYFDYRTSARIYTAVVKNTSNQQSKYLGAASDGIGFTVYEKTLGMSNVVALHDEPYMSSRHDNLQSISHQLVAIKPINDIMKTGADTWAKVGGLLADDEDFGLQIRKKLKGEEVILEKAKALKTNDEKIAYIFHEVRDGMKWDSRDRWYTMDGTQRAWEKKSGNSTEINLVLVHLLKSAGVKVYPMVVSTRENGRVNVAYANVNQFNRAVAFIPVDSTKNYVLDATNKYQPYNQVPYNLLNSMGLYIDKQEKTYDWFEIREPKSSRHTVFLDAEITPAGNLSGKAILSSTGFYKNDFVERFKSGTEDKYKTYLTDKDNHLKIKAIKLENAEVDSLPLAQNIEFDMEPNGSDGDYIYLVPNAFSTLRTNPFLNQNRMTDVDLGYLQNYNIYGVFKVPAGYKADALPKNINMVMPDKSISFRRMVVEDAGSISIRYIIDYKKAIFYRQDYPAFHEFFKQMQDMLNEQIVLKKS